MPRAHDADGTFDVAFAGQPALSRVRDVGQPNAARPRLSCMRSAVAAAIAAALLLAGPGCTSVQGGAVGHLAGTERRAAGGGPSAAQLARGRWVAIPAAPIRLCYPLVAWTGRVLVVVEPGFPPCPRAAATYEPRANRWNTIARPPAIWRKGGVFLGSEPVAAFGGGRYLLVSPSTGKAIAWNSSTGRWAKVHPLPALGAVSAGWTGRAFLVATARQLRVNVGIARVFALTGSRWTTMPSLPQPRSGRIAEAVPTASGGSVYALVSDAVWHANPNDQYVSGSVRLLRLAASSWIPVPLGAGVPVSQLTVAGAGGAVLAAGSACPGLGGCLQENGAAALLWPGRRTAVVPLLPRQGVPYPQDFAAGGHAVVVVYSDGIGGLPGHKAPAPGSSVVYDIRAHRWLAGPPAPARAVPLDSAGSFWTPGGVVTLALFNQGLPGGPAVPASGRAGGWLLLPAPSSSS